MRTNIVLDDALVAEAMQLSVVKTKKELIHNALKALIILEKQQIKARQEFLDTYVKNPVELDTFQPMSRDEVNER
ncbi:MAG TPA: DUF2191 domain-containing protein [Gammaproteobacteria bacterium]|nr:DUF2191 domain-containing protein [Gammaproteobacteria bacterium]